MRTTRIFSIIGIVTVVVACLCLGFSPQASAGSFRYDCTFVTWPGGARSKINLSSRLPKGKYFAIVQSGDGDKKKTKPKVSSGKQQLEFEFDSDPEDVAAEGKTQIAPHFNKSARFTGQIRAVGSNKKYADTGRYRSCEKIVDDVVDPGTEPPPTTEPPPAPPPCRIDDNPSPSDPNGCSGGGKGSGSGSGK